MTDDEEHMQRSLGRIEGVQAQILAEFKLVRETLGDHVNADQLAFSQMRVYVSDQKDILVKQFENAAISRNGRLDKQDEKLSELSDLADRIKRGGKFVLWLIGLITAILSGVLIMAIATWLHLKT